MFRRLIKKLTILEVIFPLACLACTFADLRPIGISSVPELPWAVLPSAESPVIFTFDTEMEKTSVERSLQINSPSGAVDGKSRWEENKLFFVPSVPWKPGIRYALKFSGTISAADGRERPVSINIPFYAVSRPSLPYLVSVFPEDGESVGTSEVAALEINFSLPMDRRATENALKFDIPGEKIFTWQNDDKTMSVSSDRPLNPWTVYNWSISDKAVSADGAPLAKEFRGRFITDLEKEFLKVIQVVPLMPPDDFSVPLSNSATWGHWVEAAPCLEQGLSSGWGIGVKFNKTPDPDSLRRAFSFIPPLSGRVEILSPVSALFIPSKDPEPETVYRMRISGTLKDDCGLNMGEDFTTSFTSDIPFLEIISFSLLEDETGPINKSGSHVLLPVNSDGITRSVIHFSLAFDSGNTKIMEEAAFKISLNPFFPASLPPVSLRAARWVSRDRLLLEWEGVKAGESGVPHFYKLVIPGGSGAVHNGTGSYLKDDFILYLEAEK